MITSKSNQENLDVLLANIETLKESGRLVWKDIAAGRINKKEGLEHWLSIVADLKTEIQEWEACVANMQEE
jgi:hypothetical protein